MKLQRQSKGDLQISQTESKNKLVPTLKREKQSKKATAIVFLHSNSVSGRKINYTDRIFFKRHIEGKWIKKHSDL